MTNDIPHGVPQAASQPQLPFDNEASGVDSGAPWLISHRVALPDTVEGYVERPELEQRIAAIDRRLTVIYAPGGFGKTVLLARCCRRFRQEGVVVAWLTLDEHDGPIDFVRYIEFAFERAGFDTFESIDRSQASNAPTGETEAPAEYRINLLIRAIGHNLGKRFLLALDEVERLRDPESIAVLNLLLRSAPSNLSFAMAYRYRPQGLDTATHFLESRGELIVASELRFSTSDIARLFDSSLSRKALARVENNSAGWPIALRLYRNAREVGMNRAELHGDDDTMAAWIESRLWRDLSSSDRDFILDISLFDWIDPVMIDEATGRQHSLRRIEAMSSLSGLLQTTEGDDSIMRLHPLIKRYCMKRRYIEDPSRFRTIHAEIAAAMAKRGYLLEAMRHGTEAGDPRLAAKFAEQEGAIRLWFRRGFDVLRAVDGWLTEEVISMHPRLALLRCAVLAMSGDMEGARRVYEPASSDTEGFTRNPHGDVNKDLQIEHWLVRGLMLIQGCSFLRDYESLVSQAKHYEESDLDPLARGVIRFGLAVTSTEGADFETAAIWLERARADLGRNTPHLSAQVDFQQGLAAMAQGRCEQAAKAYRSGIASANLGHVGDATTVMTGEILTAELAFERTTGVPKRRSTLLSPRLLAECGAWLDVYVANMSVTAELALLESGVDGALAVAETAIQFARTTNRSALARLMSAIRVSFLVRGERVDEADKAWRSENLPVDQEACLDLTTQRWREIEAVAGARLLLLNARGELEAARELAAGLLELAEKRNLIRTMMRSLALAMRMEYDAGAIEAALEHLAAFLRLFSKTDYARPLVRERKIAIALLEQVMDSRPDDPVAVTAAQLLDALTHPDKQEDDQRNSDLTREELEVLQLLGANSDKEIAKQLHLSHDGLRYRVRRIFAKLGAKGRHDAVHRARELGVLPPEFSGTG